MGQARERGAFLQGKCFRKLLPSLVSDDGFQIVHVDRGGLDIIDQINEVLD